MLPVPQHPLSHGQCVSRTPHALAPILAFATFPCLSPLCIVGGFASGSVMPRAASSPAPHACLGTDCLQPGCPAPQACSRNHKQKHSQTRGTCSQNACDQVNVGLARRHWLEHAALHLAPGPSSTPGSTRRGANWNWGAGRWQSGSFWSREELTSQPYPARSPKPHGQSSPGALHTSGMSSGIPCPQDKVWGGGIRTQSPGPLCGQGMDQRACSLG